MPTQQITTPNNKTEKISFIITAYNLPLHMIKECLKSILVLSLNRKDREIIIVDDGSDLSVINDLIDYRDDFIYLRQPNRGVSAARNAGLRLATGKFIQFVDGDDYILQAPYEHCIDIVRYYNPDIVLFDMTNKKHTEPQYYFTGPVDGSEYMLHNNIHGSACCCIFKKDMLIDLRFTEGRKYGEDEEFIPRLILRSERLFYTNSQAYYYRKHAASVLHKTSPKDKIKRLDDNVSVILRLSQLADTLTPLEREALNRRVAQLTMDYIYNVITLTHNSHYLENCIRRLYERGLFPLPDKKYTTKYAWFRKFTMTKTGRNLLCKFLPRLS